MKTIDPRVVSSSSSLFLFFSLEGFADSLIEGSVIEWPLRCETKSNRFRSEAEKRETSLALVQRHWLENCFRRPRVAPLYNFYGVPVYFRRYTTPHSCHKGFRCRAISFDAVTLAQAAVTRLPFEKVRTLRTIHKLVYSDNTLPCTLLEQRKSSR